MASLQFVGITTLVDFKKIGYADLVLSKPNKGAAFKLIAENSKATELLHSLKTDVEFEMTFIV